jgi:hypothetical protein
MSSTDEIISNDKVRYSRAGDAFHYRWAARRCLKMLYPLSTIKSIVIEGSKERKMAGEYIIDIAEYYTCDDESEAVNYYQLKHTTVNKDLPFNLSDLKDTIIGFADRYKEHISKNQYNIANYYVVTNRIISNVFKVGVEKLKKNEECDKRFLRTLKNYTKLETNDLISFCKCLKFLDGIGDFQNQWYDLYYDTAKLLAGDIGHPQIDTITAFVSEKALPGSDGVIYAEDLLKRFGCTSKRDLYPAPIEIERLNNPIIRKQYLDISSEIMKSTEPVIVHATGGVGKSVFAMVLKDLLPKESVVITYDCFGLGKYRNRTQTRHRYRDGIVQIANELSGKGLSDPLIVLSTALDDEILRMFLERLQIAVGNVRNGQENGEVYIIIDAADNAEMAAQEFGDNCFVHELLREQLPEHCHLVMLCRTERIELLEPSSLLKKIELLPFDKDESLKCLREHFKDATEDEGEEFHRLTNGNPRVQANAIAFGKEKLRDVLEELGPKGSTVEKQIELQLERAIEKIKDRFTKDYQKQIEDICCGIASLPPFIPISVLAIVADTDESIVISFISDLGRPIWVADSVVQFRDEPTETWFRKKYLGTVNQVRNYISKLKPIASQFTYISEVLPILYLQAEYYDELIDLALSEDCLPEENPIDRRNVQMFRLNFAFKAALKLNKYYDASKLAMLAGEETAGNKRQMEIFKNNIDLIAPLQDVQKVQELAFKREIRGSWEGSENVYSASLLSNIPEFRGEARAYLRAAERWLSIYFDEREKKREGNFYSEKLNKEDIIELIFSHYNLNGIEYAVKFMTRWTPESFVFEIVGDFINKLIDLGKFHDIEEISRLSCENIYAILAINNELFKVGHFVGEVELHNCIVELDIENLKMPHLNNTYYNDNILEAMLSFAEACIANNLYPEKILMMLDKFIPIRVPVTFDSDYKNKVRNVYLRTTALRNYLNVLSTQKEDEWLPEKYLDKKKNYSDEQEIQKIKQVFGALIPWFNCRLSVLVGNYDKLNDIINEMNSKTEGILHSRYRKYDILPFEIAQVCVEIMLFDRKSSLEEIKSFYFERIKRCDTIWIDSRIQALRGANRIDCLKAIRNDLEDYVYKSIINSQDDTEIKANYYIELARATVTLSKEDAAEYFNMAIIEVSRFGDELPSRWKAISAIAKRCAEEYHEEAELSYRFIRCAEMVGDNIAREKYWDRDEAIKICTELSPATGLAAISRWRDRCVGWFENQFPVVAITIAEANYLKPEAIWALSGFINDSDMLDLAIKCISNTKSKKIANSILESVIKYFRILDVSFFAWNKLKEFINQSGAENDMVEMICDIMGKIQKDNTEKTFSQEINKFDDMSVEEKESIFNGLNLINGTDIDIAISRFRSLQYSYRNKEVFWKTFFSKIPEGNVASFMEKLIVMPCIDFYKLTDALPYLPETWMKKPSFRKKWPLIIKNIATIHAKSLLDWNSRRIFLAATKLSEEEMKIFIEGIVNGLAKQENIEIDYEYFDFVTVIQNMITPEESKSLLEFSLSRFETNIDNEFGDGAWSKWLIPSNIPEMNMAGLIWSALGSPEVAMRWKAVHVVKRLGEFNCGNEIRALLLWAQKNFRFIV